MAPESTSPTPAEASSTSAGPASRRELIAALFRHGPGEPRLGDATPGEIADAVLAALAPDLEDCDQFRELLRPVDGFWIVPKISHDEAVSVGPRLHGDWIRREAGTSDATHARRYAAQLLAAADAVEEES